MNDTNLYTCIVKCKVCGAELDRAMNVPDEHRMPVNASAPISGRCKQESHNSGSDLNFAIVLEWYRETRAGLEFVEKLEAPSES